MNLFRLKPFLYLIFSILILLTLLRLVNLGYSEFQGDEISAQNYLFDHQNFWQFLMTRTIGPMQYLVTLTVNFWVFSRSSNPEFWVRLPFALASILSIFGTFCFVRKNFGLYEALGSSILVAGSGLLFAFSRFAQYQSFVILIGIWAMHLFLISSKKGASPKFLILLGVISGFGLLFHYDALTFIIPIFALLLFEELPKFKEKKNSFFQFLFQSRTWYFSFSLVLITSIFYLPYFLNPKIKSTLNYLFLERISTETKFDSVFYSAQIFSLYHPFLIILLTSFLLTFLLYRFFPHINKIQRFAIIVFLFLISVRFFFIYPNNFLIYASLLSFIFLILILTRTIFILSPSLRLLVIWLSFSFFFYGLFISKPMTHIYTFLVPFFILFPILLYRLLPKVIYLVLILIYGVFLITFNYQAFIDVSPEFPWDSKEILLENKISIYEYSFRFDGVFGFPYKRNWTQISTFLHQYDVKSYSSNEKYRLTKYYLRDFKWKDEGPDAIILVLKPQSLSKPVPPKNYNLVSENQNYQIFFRDENIEK